MKRLVKGRTVSFSGYNEIIAEATQVFDAARVSTIKAVLRSSEPELKATMDKYDANDAMALDHTLRPRLRRAARAANAEVKALAARQANLPTTLLESFTS
jgi:hypothetical protein